MRKHTPALALLTVAALVTLSVASTPVAFAAGLAPQILVFQPEPLPTSISFTITVVPGGSPTTIVLDYGTTPAMGSTTAPQSVGDGTGPVTVTQTIEGLMPTSTYYVALVASNAIGRTPTGAVQVMTAPSGFTPPSGPGTGTGSSGTPGSGTQAGPSNWSVERLAHPAGRIGVAGPGVVEMSVPSVSCASPTHCVAVGSDLGLRRRFGPLGPLVEIREGAKWSIPSLRWPRSVAVPELSAVSCPTVSSCTALVSSVGSPDHSITPPHPFAVVEMGRAWKFEQLPTFPVSLVIKHAFGSSVILAGVSCTSASFCMAVGQGGSKSNTSSNGFPFAVVERGATWNVVLAPRLPNSQPGLLSGVSCSSPSACIAVGTQTQAHTQAPLIEEWNGAHWSIAVYPKPVSGSLLGVSCSSPSTCVAVGEGGAQGLVMSRQGAEWQVEPGVPVTPGSFDPVLSGVSCRSRSACTVVGFDQNQTGQAPLLESGAGQSWTSEELPHSTFVSTFADSSVGSGTPPIGVSCASATSCTAVGFYATRTNTGLPIAITTTP